jgi:uncharacterized protein (AIM24 family)
MHFLFCMECRVHRVSGYGDMMVRDGGTMEVVRLNDGTVRRYDGSSTVK